MFINSSNLRNNPKRQALLFPNKNGRIEARLSKALPKGQDSKVGRQPGSGVCTLHLTALQASRCRQDTHSVTQATAVSDCSPHS